MIIRQCKSCKTYCLKGQLNDDKCLSCRIAKFVEQESQESELLEVDQVSQETKICIKCKEQKLLYCFKKDKRSKDGFRKACTDCE